MITSEDHLRPAGRQDPHTPGGFGGTISAPADTDSDAGTKLLTKHVPSSAANPTNLIYKLSQPVWNNPDPVNAAVLPLRDAVSRAVGATGTTVTSAGLMLAGTFAVFALVGGRGSGGSQIRDIGWGWRSAC
jgi:hypothetical protein